MNFFIDEEWTGWLEANEDSPGFYLIEDMPNGVEWRIRYNESSGWAPVAPDENPCDGEESQGSGWELEWIL